MRHPSLYELVQSVGGERLAVEFVPSRWAAGYAKPQRLKISMTPALTWGTATYVTPLAFPLSSVLYGRIGLVTSFSPDYWTVFDATDPAARAAYVAWAQAQPNYPDLLLTVHSTYANHVLRNKFRKDFTIDCVLFHPDQEADLHTDLSLDVWMAVTDWLPNGEIDTRFSDRLADSRFTILIDEEFDLSDSGGLPIQVAARKIEATTAAFPNQTCAPLSRARSDRALPGIIAHHFANDGYVHIFVEP